MKKIFLIFYLITLNFYAFAGNPRIIGDRCANDFLGTPVCPPRGGDIAIDGIGQLVCGIGQCALNAPSGIIQCSKEPYGNAATDAIGIIKCSGGCESPSVNKCKKLN